jgi:hypothetical protein
MPMKAKADVAKISALLHIQNNKISDRIILAIYSFFLFLIIDVICNYIFLDGRIPVDRRFPSFDCAHDAAAKDPG